MNFIQETRVSRRTKEINQIFIDRKSEIRADIENLELSFRDIERKYKVNNRNVARWAEKLGIDPSKRSEQRRILLSKGSKPIVRKTPPVEDRPQAHKLIGLW